MNAYRTGCMIVCCAGLLLVPTSAALAQRGALAELLERERAKEAQEKKLKEIDENLKKKAEQSLDKSRQRMPGEASGSGRQVYSSERELPLFERQLISVEPSEETKHLQFLKRADTGLFRILNLDEGRIAVNDIRTQSAYPHIPGFGTYYSFSRRSHQADEWAQLRLVGGVLMGGYEELRRTTSVDSGGVRQDMSYVSGYSIGIFTSLGDCALEQIDGNPGALEALRGFRLPVSASELAEKRKALANGIDAGSYRLTSKVAAEPGVTYLMRSVLFKRSDSLIAFRVVLRDGDHGVHILWRFVSRLPVGQLRTR